MKRGFLRFISSNVLLLNGFASKIDFSKIKRRRLINIKHIKPSYEGGETSG